MIEQRPLSRVRQPGIQGLSGDASEPDRSSPPRGDAPPTPPKLGLGARMLGLFRQLWFEATLTRRLIAGNTSATILPGLACTAAACAHHGVTGWRLVSFMVASLALGFLYVYVFDTSNQAIGAEEDRINKPNRPIPLGLTTPAGLWRRFWAAVPVYLLLGWLTGTLIWVALWLAVVVGQHLVAKPRHYLWTKPIGMLVGAIAQLGCFWQLVGPIDTTGWTWILVLAITFNLALRYEDIRDIDGDRELGRTSLPILIGHWPVRLWFAIVMAAMPIALHVMLFAPSTAPRPVVLACAAVIAAMSWTCTVRSLALRTTVADHHTYMLYTLVYPASLACGAVLLGPA